MMRLPFSLASVSKRACKSITYHRFFSVNSVPVTSDSYINLSCSVPDLSITITSQWRDTVEWDHSDNLEVSHVYEQGDLFLSVSVANSLVAPLKGMINLRTPEMINLDASSTQSFGLATKNKVLELLNSDC